MSTRFVALVCAPLCALLAAALPLAAQEVAPVTVRGEAVFSVVAIGDTAAPLRARQIAAGLQARLDTDEPLAPLRVVSADTLSLILVADDTLARVTRRDAEVALARPVEPGPPTAAATRAVALQWAESLRALFERIAAEERAWVVLEGIRLFDVGGTPELRAPRRAAAIGLRVDALAAAPGEPPPIRALRRGAARRCRWRRSGLRRSSAECWRCGSRGAGPGCSASRPGRSRPPSSPCSCTPCSAVSRYAFAPADPRRSRGSGKASAWWPHAGECGRCRAGCGSGSRC